MAEQICVYVATCIDIDDWNNQTIRLIAEGTDRESVWNAFLDELPKRIEHWDKRYCEWDATTLKAVEEIYPKLHHHPWFTVINVNDGDGQFNDEPLYVLHRHFDREDCEEYATAFLTREQKAKLFELLGGTWYPSRRTQFTYAFKEIPLVPTQIIE
jgi:hypothetical protein